MMATETAILRVKAEDEANELRRAIVHVCASVKRMRNVPGFYDKGHDRINGLLDELDRVTALDAAGR